MKKTPLRRCVVTNERLPKSDLLRIVKDKYGNISFDITGKSSGRGAYIKKDIEVLKKAKDKKILERVLEAKISEEVYKSIEEIIKNNQEVVHMMNVSEYASDVGVTVKEILELCNKLDIKVSKEDDMLSDDDIIILDNELASIQPSEESTEELEELEELEDIEESYEEQIKEENKAKKKKTAKPTNKNDFKEKRKEMYKHK